MFRPKAWDRGLCAIGLPDKCALPASTWVAHTRQTLYAMNLAFDSSSINHGIQQVMIDASYAWGHRQLGPQAAVTPGTHKTAP